MTERSTVSDPGNESAKRVFELFVETLVLERDTADASLLIRLKWYGEDVVAAISRLGDDPRAARDLVHHLSRVIDQLELDARTAETMEENVHQARRWVLLLPGVTDETPVAGLEKSREKNRGE